MLFRQQLHQQCLSDPIFAEHILHVCMRDTLFWMKAYGWVLNPTDFEGLGTEPFMPWECQKNALDVVESCMRDGEDGLGDKSRAMGATWLILFVFYKYWAWFKNKRFGLGSRTAELVDNGEDSDALMWKLDFIYKHQPSYLKPRRKRLNMKFINVWNGNSILGYAFNKNFNRGGRKTAIMLDEFAYPQDPGDDEAVLASTAAVTKTRFFISSLDGPSGTYYKLLQQCKNNPPNLRPARMFVLDWKDVPERRAGLYTHDKGHLVIIDKSYDFPSDYPFIPDNRLRSPYLDYHWRRLGGNARLVAKEYERNAGRSGAQYFDPEQLDMLAKGACEPYQIGRLFRNDRSVRFQEGDRGPFSLWTKLDHTFKAPPGEYGIGIDLCGGTGTSVTNSSVAHIIDRMTGEQVAEYACNNERPREFAKSVYALCLMFHEPFVCWENNGGYAQNFAEVLMKELRYFNVRYKVDATKVGATPTKDPGWFNGNKGKETIFEPWYMSMFEGQHLVRSVKVFEEARCYVIGLDGKVVYRNPESDIDPGETGKAHGDRVVAAALANLCMRERPVERIAEPRHQEEVRTVGAPFGSFAHFMQLQKNRAANSGSLTNFG